MLQILPPVDTGKELIAKKLLGGLERGGESGLAMALERMQNPSFLEEVSKYRATRGEGKSQLAQQLMGNGSSGEEIAPPSMEEIFEAMPLEERAAMAQRFPEAMKTVGE